MPFDASWQEVFFRRRGADHRYAFGGLGPAASGLRPRASYCRPLSGLADASDRHKSW